MLNITIKKLHFNLPIFRIESENRCVLYTPGHLAVLNPLDADIIQDGWKKQKQIKKGSIAQQVGSWVVDCARDAIDKRNQWLKAPFEPECLTVYLSNYCNLSCYYCYASKSENRLPDNSYKLPVIHESIVSSAAQLVAEQCAKNGKPFYLVIHGGGEPTIHWDLLKKIEMLTRRIARRFRIEWFGYVATNGVLPEDKAVWLATHFNRVGLSCDGPPDIQDRQRPLKTLGKTSSLVERTARCILKAGGQLEIRSTITPQTMKRQVEIVSYLHKNLGAKEIRFEPAYRLWEKKLTKFQPHHAEIYAKHFLKARKRAHSMGCHLSFSGIRLNEIHGSYCDVFRNVLHLTPDGAATACFFCTHSGEEPGIKMKIGEIEKLTGKFTLDSERIAHHRLNAGRIPRGCNDCINIYHCVRECPDHCEVLKEQHEKPQPTPNKGFRCKLQQILAQNYILEAAEQQVAEKPARSISIPLNDGDFTSSLLAKYLKEIPSDLDKTEILTQWKAVKGKYNLGKRQMPLPPWAELGFEHAGDQAWDQVSSIVSQQKDAGPMSIYIHVPFCERRCGFCDCYSLPFVKNQEKKESTYSQVLISEMEAWSKIVSLIYRPVTTVHFGGGTPNCLSVDVFEQIISNCRDNFNITGKTEWAIESTSRNLTNVHLDQLKKWGFSRLHVGVQTLDNRLRYDFGRHDDANTVIKKIIHSLKGGFVVSADVIYGFPSQTFHNFLNTLTQLIETGIHGISLYQLNISKRNRGFLGRCKDPKPNAMYEYLLFQAGEQLLLNSGFQKNHFVHYVKSEDNNLYFTHPQRNEDLLALGPSADGVFGQYYYRHPGYTRYVQKSDSRFPVLEGGGHETSLNLKVRKAKRALMGGQIQEGIFKELGATDLLEDWSYHKLIKKNSMPSSYTLTANGSWFLTEMIFELEDLVRTNLSGSK